MTQLGYGLEEVLVLVFAYHTHTVSAAAAGRRAGGRTPDVWYGVTLFSIES